MRVATIVAFMLGVGLGGAISFFTQPVSGPATSSVKVSQSQPTAAPQRRFEGEVSEKELRSLVATSNQQALRIDELETLFAQCRAECESLRARTVVELDSSGSKSAEGQMRDGQKEGEWTYWHKNGKRSAIMHYHMGQLWGLAKRWNEWGQVIDSGIYVNGKKDGEWVIFDEDRVPSILQFENGEYILPK